MIPVFKAMVAAAEARLAAANEAGFAAGVVAVDA